VYTQVLADTTGVLPGDGGSGMNWDFSTLMSTSHTQVDSFMIPSATPYGDLFPSAQLALHEMNPSTDYYIYYLNDGSEFQRIANVQPDTVIYSDPANEFYYPISYGDTYNDTYYSSYMTTVTGSSSTVHMWGTISVNADGSGTLTLPSGTYNNILRVKSVREEFDTIFGQLPIVVHAIYTYYNWYQTSLYYPILAIDYTDIYPSIGPLIHTKTVGFRAVTTGINEKIASNGGLTVSPNPSSTGIFNLFPNDKQENINQVEIIAPDGRVVFSSTGNVNEIDLSGQAKGIYFYRVSMVNGETFSGKLMRN
jgi:Secretion system C-terminal sorting domain